MANFLNDVGGRKWISAGVLFIAATVFLYTGKSDFEQWSTFMQWVFGIFVFGNVGTKIIETIKANGSKSPKK